MIGLEDTERVVSIITNGREMKVSGGWYSDEQISFILREYYKSCSYVPMAPKIQVFSRTAPVSDSDKFLNESTFSKVISSLKEVNSFDVRYPKGTEYIWNEQIENSVKAVRSNISDLPVEELAVLIDKIVQDKDSDIAWVIANPSGGFDKYDLRAFLEAYTNYLITGLVDYLKLVEWTIRNVAAEASKLFEGGKTVIELSTEELASLLMEILMQSPNRITSVQPYVISMKVLEGTYVSEEGEDVKRKLIYEIFRIHKGDPFVSVDNEVFNTFIWFIAYNYNTSADELNIAMRDLSTLLKVLEGSIKQNKPYRALLGSLLVREVVSLSVRRLLGR